MVHLLVSLSEPCTSRLLVYYISKICGILRNGPVSIDYFTEESTVSLKVPAVPCRPFLNLYSFSWSPISVESCSSVFSALLDSKSRLSF